MQNTLRDKLAHQMGMLVIANAELTAINAALGEELKQEKEAGAQAKKRIAELEAAAKPRLADVLLTESAALARARAQDPETQDVEDDVRKAYRTTAAGESPKRETAGLAPALRNGAN